MREKTSFARLSLLVMIVACMLTIAACSGGSNKEEAEPSSSFNGTEVAEALAEKSEILDAEEASEPAWVIYAIKMQNPGGAADDFCMEWYDNLRAQLKSKGELDEEFYSSYERAAIAVDALGEDPTDVEGVNLMEKVDTYAKVKEQGVNAEMYALITANAVGYELKNEERYLKDVLAAQTDDGGFSLGGGETSVDMTAIGLQALAPYEGEGKAYSEGIEKGLAYLSEKQGEDGGYGNCESTAQVMIALGVLKKSYEEEEAFIKDGKTLGDGILKYYLEEEKGFSHLAEGEYEVMPTYQALIAIAAASSGSEGKSIFEK